MEASNKSKKSKSANKSETKDAKKHSDESEMPTYSEVDKNKDGVLTPKEFQKTKQAVAKKTAEENEKKQEEKKEEEKADADKKKESELEKKKAEDEKQKKAHAGGKGHGAAENSSVPAPKMPSFSDVDSNGDGVLTPSEFQKERAKVVARIEQHVKKVIKHENLLEDLKLGLIRKIDEMPAYEDLDKDRDGVLIPAEYKTSRHTAMAKNLSYATLDLDSDGAVTPEEFKVASETWAAEMTKEVQEKVEELSKIRDERRQLEKEIDRMQSYNDLDDKRDGVVTPAEYAAERKASHGAWSVNGNTSAKSGASATGLGSLAGLAALVLFAQ